MGKPTWKRGVPLSDDALERLRQLIKEQGADATVELLGIRKTTLAYAAAGIGIREVTAIAIEARLEALRSGSI